jgi:hypothetical protein
MLYIGLHFKLIVDGQGQYLMLYIGLHFKFIVDGKRQDLDGDIAWDGGAEAAEHKQCGAHLHTHQHNPAPPNINCCTLAFTLGPW